MRGPSATGAEAMGVRRAAKLPPAGLAGLDPSLSRIIDARWHLLDTGPRLAEAGIRPVGTILCVHGNPTWSYFFRELANADLDIDGAHWRVIAVDHLEMGFSARDGGPHPLARRVSELGELTELLDLDGPVITFGHDWGGAVSLGWAIDHPDSLAAVMLFNTAVHQPEGVPIPAPLRLALTTLRQSTVLTPGFLETTLSLARPALSAEVRDGYRAPYRSAADRAGIGGFVADIPVDAAHESFAELDRIATGVGELEVPALILWGPRDPIFGDRYLDDLIDRMPHAAVHRFENAGHLIAEDIDYVAAVKKWLPALQQPAITEMVEGAGDSVGTGAGTLHESPTVTVPLWKHLDDLVGSDATALVEMAPPGGGGPRRVSWRLLARRVAELAVGFRAFGIHPGDRVSLLIPPGADLTAVLYACLRIGAIPVVADAGLGVRGLTRAVRGAWPDHIIGQVPGLTLARSLSWPGQRFSTAGLPKISRIALDVAASLGEVATVGRELLSRGEHVPAPPHPESVAAILFTSGSTGPAKGVVYTHEQLAALCRVLGAHYAIAPGTPLVAGFAPFALLGPALGATSVTPEMNVTAPKTLTARAIAAAIAAAGDSAVVFLSPAALTNVVATASALHDSDRTALESVRVFLSAGAPVAPSLLAAAGELMPNAVPHTPYGMTEALLLTDATLDTIRACADSDSGVCVGTPVAGVSVRISPLDTAGASTGALTESPGVTGEIVVSAPHLKQGYDRLWLTDVEAARGTPAARWHRTGDVGHLDTEGRLFVEGRLPHVIVGPDAVLTPVAIEQRVQRIAEVERAAAVGVGPRGTQQLVIIIETEPSSAVALATPGLAALVRTAAAHPVAAVITVPKLPTDIRHNSKIDRARLSVWAEGILRGERMSRP